MKRAIEIVERMRDDVIKCLNGKNPWLDVSTSAEASTRINTLTCVLHALKEAKKETLEISKADIRDIYNNKCFVCKYSAVDEFDLSLRCWNHDSDYCTEWCPEYRCEFFEEEQQ